MAYYKIKPNQTLAELVVQVAPHVDLTLVRDHEKNSQLFAARDELVLNPGDPVWIPEEDEPEYNWQQVVTGDRITLQVTEALREFKLTVMRPNREPLANMPYVITFGDETFEGTTDAEGNIDTEVPFDATEGTVQVGNLLRRIQLGGLDPLHTIRGIQARLANMGFEPGPVDGIVGPKTSGAIEAFQAFRLLDESGVLDPATREALLDEYGC